MKFALGLLLASLLTSSAWYPVETFSTDLTIENHVLTSVNDKESHYVRIYKEDEVTTVAEHAFDDCSFTILMISKTVTTINATFPDSLKTIEFTGSIEDISFVIPENVEVIEYACDEGFLNYWGEYIRPNIDGSICNVTREHYLRMKSLYSQLTKLEFKTDDLENVNATKDGTGTIGDSITFLNSYFNASNKSKSIEKEISQSVMITLILIIASFGMTSIGLFYFLKDKKVIG